MPLTNQISVIILVLAICIFAYARLSYTRYNGRVVEKSIDVEKYGDYEFSFVSQKETRYNLELETERNLDIKEQNYRLGIASLEEHSYGSNMERLIITWSIYQADVELASGKSNENAFGFWGPNIGKTLHSFETRRGKEYTIYAKIAEIDPVLAVTNPFLQVSIDNMEYKKVFTISSLAFLVSFLLVGIAALIWVADFIYRQWF